MTMEVPATLEDPIQEASRILDFADDRGVALRLLGGVAINLRCPSARQFPLKRSYADLDFVAHQKQTKEMKALFPLLGYSPREMFNALQGHSRLIFNDLARGRRIDVFLDLFEMCHKLDFTNRLELEELTLPLADLLATKLQVVETNEKDMKDILGIFLDFEVLASGSAASIDAGYLAGLCGNDWGLCKTFMMNLDRTKEKLGSFGLTGDQRELIQRRINQLMAAIDNQPKSLRWKLRARVGEVVRWYELPVSDEQPASSAKTKNN